MAPRAAATDCELGATERQRRSNETMLAAVEAQEDRLSTLLPDFAAYNLHTLRRELKEARDLLASYESGISWSLVSMVSVPQLVRDLALEVTQRELGGEGDLVPCAALRGQAHDMVSRADRVRERGLFIPVGIRDAVEFASQQLGRVERRLRGSACCTQELSAFMLAALQTSEEALHATLVTDELTASCHATQSLTRRLRAETARQMQQEADGDVAVAEETMERVACLLEQLLRVAERKASIVADCTAEHERRFGGVWATLERSNARSHALKMECRALRKKCTDDLSSLSEHVQKCDRNDAALAREDAAHRAATAAVIQECEQNLAVQWQRCWESRYKPDLGALVAVQRQHAERRRAAVAERERRADAAERRRVAHRQLLDTAHRRRSALERRAEDCAALVECTGMLEQAARRQCVAIRRRYETVRDELKELRRRAQLEQFAFYRRAYLLLSLACSRWRRVAVIREEERETEAVRRQLAAESLSPDAKHHYIAEGASHQRSEQALQAATQLAHRADALEQRVRPLLDELDRDGVAYLHPRDELQQVLDARDAQRQAMLEYMTRGERVRIIAEREQIRRIVEWRSASKGSSTPGACGGPLLSPPKFPALLCSPGGLPRYATPFGTDDPCAPLFAFTGESTMPEDQSLPPPSPQVVDPGEVDLWATAGALYTPHPPAPRASDPSPHRPSPHCPSEASPHPAPRVSDDVD